MESPGELIGTKQAAEILGVHHSTVWRWCAGGKIPATRVGREWLITRASLEDGRPPRRARRAVREDGTT